MKAANVLYLVPLVLWLGGCATPSSPFGGAPVEDRSIRPIVVTPPPPPPTPVEVQPLSRPEPIVPREYSQSPTPPPLDAQPPEVLAPAAPAAPAAPVEAPPAQINTQGNPAVVALLDNAAQHVGAGELDKAAAALERALRIEPRNAGIWHDLGQIRLHQRDYAQAESLASKSNSLAGNNNGLRARNWRLIATARRAGGDGGGADAAEAQAVILERGGR